MRMGLKWDPRTRKSSKNERLSENFQLVGRNGRFFSCWKGIEIKH